ncbi:MAG: hypothetical protein JXA68_08890 [Ignavibacteriales bacterium]|nr:hypothetical protein [Ignavibacteriales bacterium]
MKALKLFLFLIVLIVSCDDELVIDTTKDTVSDPIADITALGNYFYTTNYDLSFKAGSQIDLMRFTTEGLLDNQFDLNMNGQGYLAITNDGQNIYLLSRRTNLIVKISTTGEKIYLKQQKVEPNWQAAGICYLNDKDSILMLYRNLRYREQYKFNIVDKNNPNNIGSDFIKTFNEFSGNDGGIFSIEYSNNNFYFIGVDTTMSINLKITDKNFTAISSEEIVDSTVVGLCIKNGDLYFSHNDRRITKK